MELQAGLSPRKFVPLAILLCIIGWLSITNIENQEKIHDLQERIRKLDRRIFDVSLATEIEYGDGMETVRFEYGGEAHYTIDNSGSIEVDEAVEMIMNHLGIRFDYIPERKEGYDIVEVSQ
jgi:hypothetical protein